MLKDLQEIILGKREQGLNDDEINSLFCISTTPEQILTLIKALNRKKIDPEKLLVSAILNAQVKEDLIPIALALRFGVDPNMYIPTCGIGTIHILAFVYVKLGESAFLSNCRNVEEILLLNSIVMLLKASGSNPLLPVFKCDKKDKSLFSLLPGKNVLDWLCENGYETILSCLDCNFTEVKEESSTMISIFLDSLKLIKTCPKLGEIILAHSYKVLENYNFDISEGLRLSVKYLNLNSFEYFINSGASLKYYQVVNMLIKMKKYKEGQDLISLSQVFNMLLYAIKTGTIFDEYQLKFLEEIDQEFAQELVNAYEESFWKKNCKILKGEPDMGMKRLIYGLNLNPNYSKEIMCQEISKIVNADMDEVKKSVIERQEKRVSSTLSNYLDFINNEPKIIPRNKSLLKNFYDYPDNDIVFYKDNDNTSWIFTRDMFTDLLESGKNPYTNQNLPKLLKEEMEARKIYYLNLFTSEEDPIPISKTLDTLTKKDKITNEITEKRMRRFYKLGKIEEEDLNIDEMKNLLKNLISEEIELKELSKKFAFVTFAVTAEEILRKDSLLSTDFFANVRMNKAFF